MTTTTTDGYPATTTAPSPDHTCDHCDPPRALERNRFYPRKLMEVRHWQAEQAYHRRARELVTRLGLGSGVLCGLEVDLSPSGTLVITHGVGVDGHGRVVVVPQDLEVDPSRLTDCCGRPTDETVSDGAVTVSLCFHECGTDLVRMPPASCDDEPACVPSMVREAYAVCVTQGATERTGLPDGLCDALFHHDEPTPQPDPGGEEGEGGAPPPPHEGDVDRRELLDRLDPRTCACAEDCIPLATVAFDGEGGRDVDTAVRTVIRSNRELLDLILCLADRLDECCDRPLATPPRIVALWPWPDEEGKAREDFAKNRRLELAFDRDMAEQGLDDPQPWLGVWLLDPKGARRMPVERAPGGLGHVSMPTGGDGAAFRVRIDSLRENTGVVVMARSTQPGPICAAGPDQLALDAELAATGLSQQERDTLWALTPDGSVDSTLGSYLEDALSGPLPWLPTGDGTAGGELHVVLRRPRRVEPPPRLLTVWPPGGIVLNADYPDRGRTWKQFLERPRVELVVSRTLAQDALADPDGWLRVWHATRDGEYLYGLEKIGLGKGEEEVLSDGSVRYVFPFRTPNQWYGVDEVLIQLRSTPPVVAGSPLGREEPKVLLDADFTGTALDSQTLFTIWSGGTFPSGFPVLQAKPTDGQTLYDGNEGGLAHWGFTAFQP